MDWNKTWVGLAGGGAGGALIAGGGAYVMHLMNVGTGQHMGVLITCKRLGLVAHAGANHAIALLLGVTNINDAKGLTASGMDFALDIGVKIGDAIKTGGKLAKLANAFLKATSKAAQQEAGKKVVQELQGDLDLDSKGRGFYLIGTPAGVGLGAGIFYEWQKVHALTGPEAWDHIPPKWKLEAKDGNVFLHMKNIPAEDFHPLTITLRVKSSWGSDWRMVMKSDLVPGTDGSYLRLGTCHGNTLYDFETTTYDVPGLCISAAADTPIRYETAFSSTTDMHKNTTMELGIDVSCGDARWSSEKYSKVWTDAKGRIKSIAVTTDWLG